VDFGVLALDAQLKAAGDITPFFLTREAGPLLLPACLDTLIETNPTPDPDRKSASSPRDKCSRRTDVQIVWRADLLPGDERNWTEIVSVQPPRSSEAITVPLFAAKAWLRQQRTADMADLEVYLARTARVRCRRFRQAGVSLGRQGEYIRCGSKGGATRRYDRRPDRVWRMRSIWLETRGPNACG